MSNPYHDKRGEFSTAQNSIGSGRQVALTHPGRDGNQTISKAELARQRGPNGERQIVVGRGSNRKAVPLKGVKVTPVAQFLDRDHAAEATAALREARMPTITVKAGQTFQGRQHFQDVTYNVSRNYADHLVATGVARRGK